MNFFPMMNRWIMTKKHNIIVLSAAILISAGIWAIAINKKNTIKEKTIRAKIFQVPDGWGYDILINDTLLFHQEFIPLLPGKKGFPEKEQAEQMAQLIINKIKKGQMPAVTTFELEQIYPLHKTENDGQGKWQ